MAGEVIIDDQHIATLLHEKLGHGGGGIGGNELQPRGGFAGTHHYDRVRQCPMPAQGIHHAGHRGATLADGAVDAQYVLVALIDDGINRHCSFAGLPVADDKFALTAADGDKGIHHLNAGFQWHSNRGAVDDGWCVVFHRTAFTEA